MEIDGVSALLDDPDFSSEMKVEVGNEGFETRPLEIWDGWLYWLKTFSPSERDSVQALKDRVGEERLEYIFTREGHPDLLRGLQNNELVLDRPLLEIIYYGLAYYYPEENIPPLVKELPPIPTYDTVRSSGKGLAGLKERLRIVVDDVNSEEGCYEMLLSRLADREPPVGTMVQLFGKTYRYDKIFASGGAYVSLLKSEEGPIIIACRGTAGGIGATGALLSCINNILYEPGLWGVEAIWPEMKEYLSQERHNDQEIILCGKSQGGAQAQLLASLIQAGTHCQVSRLVTYASLGVSKAVRNIFKATFQNQEIQIKGYYNEGDLGEMDCIPTVSGKHIKMPSAQFFSLKPPGTTAAPTPQSLFETIYYFFLSFVRAHIRQTTTMKNYSIESTERKKTDPFLEKARQILATIFDCITLTLLNPLSYEEFFQREVQVIEGKCGS